MRRRLEVGSGNSRWWNVGLWAVVVFLLPLGSAVYAGQAATFPVPEVLRPNIAFWKQIFTALDSRSGLLHDASDVTIVYHTFRNLPRPARQRQRLVERYRRRYQRILLRLAHGKRRHLSREEARVLALFKGKRRSRVLRAAARNIRFQLGLRDRFAKGLARSGAYMPTIRRILTAAGLPPELGLLPHVESSFNHRAYSKYGAAGMWQFTHGTGRRFLRIDRAIDERFDFRRATAAAATLLRQNYQELGTWPLAITAYNHGVHGMKRAIARLRTRDFGTIVRRYHSRSFGFASQNFYAEFLAVLDIVAHHKAYFRDLKFDRPQAYHTLKLDAHVRLPTVATYLKVKPQELVRWNPALRRPIIRGQRLIPKGFVLYLAHRRLSPAEAQQRWARIPATEKFAAQLYGSKYRIRPGDTLSTIAQRFRTSVATLIVLNDIDRPDLIKTGHLLRLARPPRGRVAARRRSPPGEPNATRRSRPPDPLAFVHNPASMASSHLAFHLLMAGFPLNELRAPDIEEWLQVQDGTIRVVATESLGHYATWLNIPVRRLRALNRLTRRRPIRLGMRLRLDFSKVPEERFTQRRLQYHRRIEKKFFRVYAVDGMITHTVKRGETFWTLARRQYDVPLWLLQKYNHDLEFRMLTPGTQLRIPQLVEKKTS